MDKIIFSNNQTPALNDTNLNKLQGNVEDALDLKADITSLSTVATTNNYNDLDNKPTIPTNSSFTLSGLSEKSYNNLTDKPSIPSKTSDLTNDSGFIDKDVNNLTNYTKTSDLIEEGTWTPLLYTRTGNTFTQVTYTSSIAYGHYIKIANICFIDFVIKGKITTLDGTTKEAYITGLPYKAKTTTTNTSRLPMLIGMNKNLLETIDGTKLVMLNSTVTYLRLLNEDTTASVLAVTNENFELSGSGFYTIAD